MMRKADDFATYQRPSARLWLRLLAINLLGFLIIFSSLYYLSQFQDRRADQDLATLSTEARLLAAALSQETPLNLTDVDHGHAKQTLASLIAATSAAGQLFDKNNQLIADTEVQSHDYCATKSVVTVTDYILNSILEYLSRTSRQESLPLYPHAQSKKLLDNPDATQALQGQPNSTLWQDGCGGLVLTAAAPITAHGHAQGVILLTQSGTRITDAVRTARTEILIIAGFGMGLALLLSLYLGWHIAWPLQRLAVLARQIRAQPTALVQIPYQQRPDEVGGLAVALNAMWQALRTRMNVIESFAADVAHELKNPLTSLRSAFETLPRVADNPAARDKLLGIIQHDLQRLDRLINDIAANSLLDAELARAEAPRERVNINDLVQQVVSHHHQVITKTTAIKIIYRNNSATTLYTQAAASRLEQVLGNLLDNALSFSPPHGTVTVTLQPLAALIEISVEDDGPGLPPNKLDKIFDRFYTERPDVKQFGTHSGLGLAIAKQILENYGGTISAENRMHNGQVVGARFVVQLPKNQGAAKPLRPAVK